MKGDYLRLERSLWVCYASAILEDLPCQQIQGCIAGRILGLCASAQSAADGRAPECNAPGSAQLQAANQGWHPQLRG